MCQECHKRHACVHSWFFAFSGEQIDIFDAILKKKADFATALWRISFDCGSIFSAAVQAS
jgi:hypothetical protein